MAALFVEDKIQRSGHGCDLLNMIPPVEIEFAGVMVNALYINFFNNNKIIINNNKLRRKNILFDPLTYILAYFSNYYFTQYTHWHTNLLFVFIYMYTGQKFRGHTLLRADSHWGRVLCGLCEREGERESNFFSVVEKFVWHFTEEAKHRRLQSLILCLVRKRWFFKLCSFFVVLFSKISSSDICMYLFFCEYWEVGFCFLDWVLLLGSVFFFFFWILIYESNSCFY